MSKRRRRWEPSRLTALGRWALLMMVWRAWELHQAELKLRQRQALKDLWLPVEM